MEEKNDYELVKEKNYFAIWKKYEGLISNFYKKLLNNKVYAFDNFVDFHSSCYEVVVNAVNSVKFEKIKKPDTWTIYLQLYHYLMNYTQRNVVREYYNDTSKYNLYENTGVYEDDYSKLFMKLTLDAIYEKLSPEEINLFEEYLNHEGRAPKEQRKVIGKIRKMYERGTI